MSPVVSLNVISSDLGPTVRDQRLYRFFGDQLYKERGELDVEKDARVCVPCEAGPDG